MSFILDALRKSERERQRQTAPGIGDSGFRPPKKHSNRWLIIIIAILALNAILVAALLLRGESTPGVTRTVMPASLPKDAPAPVRRPALTAPKREDIRPLAEEVPAAPEARSSPVVAVAAKPMAEPAVTPSPPSPPPTRSTPGVPTMEELVLDGRLEMNPLRLDIHVFSEQPDQRFVFINMAKYREGETTKEGPRVDSITPDGVVLNYQGNRFLVTR